MNMPSTEKNLAKTGFFNVEFVEIEFFNEESHL